ncbi:MAG: PQQ-dependent sugar dehydrogenase [Burkholderiaceae bacterium]|nr:PQQ-dependent sugar dehydrogenase [Burkholderiaceae bacterium]
MAVLLGTAAAALFAGFEIEHRRVFPHELLSKIDMRLSSTVLAPILPTPEIAARYPTQLVSLAVDSGHVPTGIRKQEMRGGGITSFGRDILVLPFDGKVYAASSSADIRVTRIQAPSNHIAEFLALADDPRFADYSFEAEVPRYNDLKYFRSARGHGLLASYTEYDPERLCYTNTLARLDFPAEATSVDEIEADAARWRIVHRTRPCLALKKKYAALEGSMAGGRLAFEAPSTVYMTSGDFHYDGMRSDGPGISQDPQAEYGKVLAIDIETGESRIVSSGHRNAQGLVRTPDGRLFNVEHGPRGGDELNLVRPGANFGWPLESYGTTYSNTRIPGSLSFGRHDHFDPPAFAWVPSVGISGLTVVSGFHPAWDGDLLASSLKDRSLYRIRLADGRPVYSERIEIRRQIRAVHQHVDGRLVLWTDDQDLIFLTAQALSNLDDKIAKYVHSSRLSGPVASRLESVVQQCAQCHSFEPGDNAKAPNLARIFGHRIASTSYDGYSNSLKHKSGRWTRETLSEFLDDPKAFAPGTSMPKQTIRDPETRDALVSFLQHLSMAF